LCPVSSLPDLEMNGVHPALIAEIFSKKITD
jgi:hypothetical protein